MRRYVNVISAIADWQFAPKSQFTGSGCSSSRAARGSTTKGLRCVRKIFRDR